MGASRIVELGGHPWVMTSEIVDDPTMTLCGSVSAEELTQWPDDIGVSSREYQIKTRQGNEANFVNYSANIERTLFDIDAEPDTVIACEIAEHLIRSPHIMFLNINHWLPVGGKLFVTTPNGAQFRNPFRRKPPWPAYRASVYSRHSYLFSLSGLTELIELCGFRIQEAGFWNVYRRSGRTKIYDLFAQLPGRYWDEKFKRTLFVVAEKVRDVRQLERVPLVYDARGNWEFIRQDASES